MYKICETIGQMGNKFEILYDLSLSHIWRDILFCNSPHRHRAISQFDGILPKGPYLPCVSMAVGPFWQDTLEL